MTNDQAPLSDQLCHALARELETVYTLLGNGRAFQHQRPPTETMAEPGDPGTHTVDGSGTIRQVSQISDMVGITVVDDSRLRLRETLTRADKDLQTAYDTLVGLRSALQVSLYPYGAMMTKADPGPEEVAQDPEP